MRVLLLGATGLIGAAVAARLVRDGHEVIGVARTVDALTRRVPAARWIALDLRTIEGPQDWAPHLAGVEAVVNCAGALQDSARDSTARVHDRAPTALWRACEAAGVRRVVQVSALGADRAALTAFTRTKAAGDAALAASNLDWVILQPSVVVGRAAYGGSALFRGLAALPFTVPIANAGPLDIVQLDDVAATAASLLAPGAPARLVLELTGPERLEFGEVIAAYRRWLGWAPARKLSVPDVLVATMFRAGDLLARFGWRPPIRSTARRELVRGSMGDNRAWREATGIEPQPLAAALAANPASVQERWFAQLYLLKPAAYIVFILFWISTGVIALTAGWDQAVAAMLASPAASVAAATVVAGALADFAVAALLMFRRTARVGLIAALGLSVAYLASGTLLRPDLWADPLGPMMKVLPILALNLLLLAMLDER